jgi:DNA ligase (NAD+)
MSPAPQKRQPKGIPVGGEFAATAHSEAGIVLTRPGIADGQQYDAAVERALSAAKAYEQTDTLEMDDAEFDRLLADIKGYEDAFGLEPEHDLHSSVGHGGAAGGDVEHATPMLSLEKPGEDAVIDFAEKHPKAVIEPKIDGLAISARYKDGKLFRAARRGDGYTGEDVTDRVRGVDGLPETAGEGDFEVRGELYLSDENKAKANAIREAAGKAPFANARNGVAGMLNKQDGSYAGLFSFAAYSTTMD